MSATTGTDKNRRRRRLGAILVVGSLAVAGLATGSLAIFTDQNNTAPNSFHAGTIKLDLGVTNWPAFSSLDVKPGDTIGWTPLTVTNAGENALRWAMTNSHGGAGDPANKLADAIVVKIAVDGGTGSCSTQGTTFYGGADGLSLSGVVLGDPRIGPDTGDQTLAASTSTVLCFWANLPFNASVGDTAPPSFNANTDNQLQGLTTSFTLHFYAEQTKNNL